MSGLGGPNVHAIMVARGSQGQTHEPVQHPGRLTTVTYVEGQANAQPHVNRMLSVQVSKTQYMHKLAWKKKIIVIKAESQV